MEINFHSRRSSSSSEITGRGSSIISDMDRDSGVGFKKSKLSFNPLSCLRILSEEGHVYSLETFEMIDEGNPEFRQRRWRAEVWDARHSELKGVGEAPRKQLAKHAAILDMMTNLRDAFPERILPPCKIPKGVQINPYILSELRRLCSRQKLELSDYKTHLVNIHGQDKFKTTILVGDQVFTDTSYEERYSHFLVALKAYKAISGEDFKLDNFYTGANCLDRDAFVLVDVEENHVVHANEMVLSKLSRFLIIGSGNSGTISVGSNPKKRSYMDTSLLTPRLSPLLTTLRKRSAQRKEGHNSYFSVSLSDILTQVEVQEQTADHPSLQPVRVSSSLESVSGSSQENLFLAVDKIPEKWNFMDLSSSE